MCSRLPTLSYPARFSSHTLQRCFFFFPSCVWALAFIASHRWDHLRLALLPSRTPCPLPSPPKKKNSLFFFFVSVLVPVLLRRTAILSLFSPVTYLVERNDRGFALFFFLCVCFCGTLELKKKKKKNWPVGWSRAHRKEEEQEVTKGNSGARIRPVLFVFFSPLKANSRLKKRYNKKKKRKKRK